MNLIPFTLHEQIGSVEREIAMRKKVYPRWVSQGKITREKAEKEIGLMEAVLATLNAVIDKGATP